LEDANNSGREEPYRFLLSIGLWGKAGKEVGKRVGAVIGSGSFSRDIGHFGRTLFAAREKECRAGELPERGLCRFKGKHAGALKGRRTARDFGRKRAVAAAFHPWAGENRVQKALEILTLGSRKGGSGRSTLGRIVV